MLYSPHWTDVDKVPMPMMELVLGIFVISFIPLIIIFTPLAIYLKFLLTSTQNRFKTMEAKITSRGYGNTWFKGQNMDYKDVNFETTDAQKLHFLKITAPGILNANQLINPNAEG
ncbi:MAG: hypothetical protein ACRCTY_06120, partial [Candidatus Adiutrix sp.]